jgi:hypothetical protein
MRYLISLLICISMASPALASNFKRDGITYHTNKSSKIKNKVRNKVYISGQAKKLKLKDTEDGWEVVDA